MYSLLALDFDFLGLRVILEAIQAGVLVEQQLSLVGSCECSEQGRWLVPEVPYLTFYSYQLSLEDSLEEQSVMGQPYSFYEDSSPLKALYAFFCEITACTFLLLSIMIYWIVLFLNQFYFAQFYFQCSSSELLPLKSSQLMPSFFKLFFMQSQSFYQSLSSKDSQECYFFFLLVCIV